MKGTWAVVLCSLFLIAAEIQGKRQQYHKRSLGKIEVIPKSSSCDHVEIIATMKPTGEQRCLNPNSKWVQKMVTALIKKR
uniref:Chemokine interleukin-8-like domain-containing protein n=1 Tax=Chelonoidis abingdonii TaxID=106734 RepID=A0A8C0GW37_CHEAB